MKYNPGCDLTAFVKSMTLEQKIDLQATATSIMTKAMPELGLPAMCIADGATGISYLQVYLDRLQAITKEIPKTSILNPEIQEELNENIEEAVLRNYNEIYQRGDDGSIKYQLSKTLVEMMPNGKHPTTFPSGVVLGSTWNPDRVFACGANVAKEMAMYGVDVILGPNVDIQRDPLCGRGYECYSEDPYLVGAIAAAFIRGVQSAGVAACAKHFAVNNQETNRQRINTLVSERALREIYLKGFEASVKDGKTKSIMMAYNKVNGEHCAENAWLMKDILRDDWGFAGCVVSDWGAARDEARSITAGLDMVLPQHRCDLQKAIEDGQLSMEDLDRGVLNILKMYEDLNGMTGRPDPDSYDDAKAVQCVYDCIVDGAVLLKNDGVLPLSRSTRTAVWGRRSRELIDCGGGSTQVFTKKTSQVYDRIQTLVGAGNYNFETLDEGTQALVYTVAYPGHEHTDNLSLQIEHADRKKIRTVLADAKARGIKTVVALNTAGPVDMRDWIDYADAVLCVYLPGCEGGNAIADILFGEAVPGGRLAQTFPYRYEDTPSCLNFPGYNGIVNYGEDIFVGYRYYDKKKIAAAYPFGFGLSYSSFTVSADCASLVMPDDAGAAVTVPVTVKNTGSYRDSEVVQLYVGQNRPHVLKPVRELKAFAKVYLAPGEEKTVNISIKRSDLQYFDADHGGWCVDPGEYTVYVGRSSVDFVAEIAMTVEGPNIYGIGAHSTINEIAGIDCALACMTEIVPDFMERLPVFLRDFDGESLAEVYDSIMSEYYINPIQGMSRFEGACRKMNSLYAAQ